MFRSSAPSCCLTWAALLLAGVVKLSERRGAFVSAVTHELRTPITALRSFNELLQGPAAETG